MPNASPWLQAGDSGYSPTGTLSLLYLRKKKGHTPPDLQILRPNELSPMDLVNNQYREKNPRFLPKLEEKKEKPRAQARPLDWLSGGGEIADLIRSRDWAKTPLGPIEHWPSSLRTTISLCLASNFPINIIWGPEAIQIYNAGYRVICGGIHPRAIGESYRVTWKSAWPAIGEPFERALRGETSYLENQRMFLCRNGYMEETFFTFSLSPIRNESGVVVGLFHPVTETTTEMLNHRRTRLLRDISLESANSNSVNQAIEKITLTLKDYISDVPGALFILEDETGKYVVAGRAGDTDGFTDLSRWPLETALATLQPYFMDRIAAQFGNLQCAEYGEAIQRACLLPIMIPGRKRPLGCLIVTLSTRLPLDETYRAFFDLLINAVNTALTNAEANENIQAERTIFQSDIHNLKTERHFQNEAAQLILEAKFAAEAATRSKSAFLANMSHEIRTPLSAILGFTDILKTTKISAEDRAKYLDIIGRNGEALVRIIDDILDLSKIEAGKIQLEQAPLCLSALVQEVMAMFSDRARGKGLSLRFDSNGLPNFKINSDAIRIRQILVNLLGNAIKFTTEGSVLVTGSYRMLAGEACEITISIADTGIGITNEQAGMLFEAFTQADNTTTRHYGGTGLGLALSKKMAKALGGNISIEKNNKAHGTTFLVELVANKSATEADPQPQVPSLGKNVRKKRLQDWKILVVDDAEDNRVLMRIFLEREGVLVDEASSGEEAIRKAQARDYDVVLMDIQMPNMDGYEALERLRSAQYRKPIFALTAHTMKEERDRALAAGFTGHISKPVVPGVLVDTLISHTRRLN